MWCNSNGEIYQQTEEAAKASIEQQRNPQNGDDMAQGLI